jgi:acyl-CoA synthetase (AMP-forming)/AMP-acid ligase II
MVHGPALEGADVPESIAILSNPVMPRPAHPTLVGALEAAAAADAPYVTFHGAGEPRALDARAALAGARRWARVLHAHGARRGDRVGLLLPTGPAFVTALLGAMLAGAIPVPLAAPLTFGKLDRYLANVARILTAADARVLLTSPRVRDAGTPLPVTTVLTEADLAGVPPREPTSVSLDGADTALLQFTSGTTGAPKGAVISHRALVSNAFAIARGLDLRADDVGVSWLPLFHDMGLVGVLLTAIAHPYAVHVMSPESFVMRPARWLDTMARVGGTISCAPNFGYELATARAADSADAAGATLERVRILLSGAEPVRAATVARFVDRFASRALRADAVLPVYGMAESTLAVTFGALDARFDVVRDVVSVGAPVAGTSVAVIGDDGRPASERAIGEIHVAGPSLMDGYFRNDEASAEALCSGWLRTGDLGFVDRGRLFVTGRAKDVIIQGGRNVHAVDVERVAHEACGLAAKAVAAFARRNDGSGTDDLVVLIETLERDETRRASLATAVRGEVLAAIGARVDHVRFCPVGAAPRTTSGKIRRAACARFAFGDAA